MVYSTPLIMIGEEITIRAILYFLWKKKTEQKGSSKRN